MILNCHGRWREGDGANWECDSFGWNRCRFFFLVFVIFDTFVDNVVIILIFNFNL